MARVFLSYARDDAELAGALAARIEQARHQVWWDQHIKGGSRFADEIDRQLRQADSVVVLWTEASIGSAWVQDEAAEGRDSGRLVPVTVGGCKPPLGFRQFQSIDLGDWSGDGEPRQLDALLNAVTNANRGIEASSAPAAATDEGQRPGVCVLPFINMSGDMEQEYFSDGITEDIITDLSKVSALSVVARNTAFTFKGRAIDVKDVAGTLGISHVVEGSVRKSGSRVRITAQLIDGKAGDHVWAERYDRELDDIFAIQDELSKAIVDALQLKLLPQEKKAIAQRGTSSVEAYNIYLMARQHWISGTFGNVRRDEAIVRFCRQATLLDPNYAQAWALMALAQSELRFWHGREENALPAAERALSLNPNLPEALCVKARYLEEEGRYAEANAQIETALRLDSESWEVNREAARLLFRQGRIRDSIPYFEKAAALMSSDFHNLAMLHTCYTALGDRESLKRVAAQTIERSERAAVSDPTNGTALASGAHALAALGQKARAREWIERALLLDPENHSMRYNVACVLVVELQDVETALDVMQPYFDGINSTTLLRHLTADPDWDSIRDHPRFRSMVAAASERLGWSPAKAD